MNFKGFGERIGRVLIEVGLPFRYIPGGTEYNCETIRLSRDPQQNVTANIISPPILQQTLYCSDLVS